MGKPGQLLQRVRRLHGVSQKRLAMRAGTTQSAISRIERDRVSPSVETLRELLFLLGEDLILDARPREPDIDIEALHERLRLTPGERLDLGMEVASRMINESQSPID